MELGGQQDLGRKLVKEGGRAGCHCGGVGEWLGPAVAVSGELRRKSLLVRLLQGRHSKGGWASVVGRAGMSEVGVMPTHDRGQILTADRHNKPPGIAVAHAVCPPPS